MIKAQQLMPTVLNSAGKFLPESDFTLEYSIGEVATTTIGEGDRLLTQGFLQPLKIKMLEKVSIIIPNVITPNGDGINEKFHISNLEYFTGSSLVIYNRWGQQVYQSADYKNEWDGAGLGVGVYYYRLETKEFGEFKGWLQILR